MRSAVLALLGIVLSPPILSAQTPVPGTRIRLSAPQFVNTMEVAGSARLQTGTVVELDSASLTLRTESGATITYPVAMIRRVEVSAGEVQPADGAARGMATGVVVGAGLAGMGVLLARVAGGMRVEPTKPIRAERVIGAGAVAGAVVGGVLGSTVRERWVRVRGFPAWGGLDTGGGARLGLSFSF